MQSLCDGCAKADRSCPIFPSDTLVCVDFAPASAVALEEAMLLAADMCRGGEDAESMRAFGQLARLVQLEQESGDAADKSIA